MKKALFLATFFLTGVFSFSQIIQPNKAPNLQQFGSATTMTRINGVVYPVVGMVNGTYADTASANLNSYVKNFPYVQIVTNKPKNTTWLRDSSATRWVRVGQINSFTFNTDSSIVICYNDGHCDTISIGNSFLSQFFFDNTCNCWRIDSTKINVKIDNFTFNNDTTAIICFASGVCDTFTFNNNNVFLTVNNAFGGCNNLLRGGVVTPANPTVNLVMDVTAAQYTIGCKNYSSPLSQVTLANGDATFGRFDVVAVDTNNQVIVIQGTPSANPEVPQINPASQLELTHFLVPAGATTASQLGITQTVIYDQNLGTPTEWNGAATSWTSDRDNLTNPFHLTKCDLVSGTTISASQISWTTTDTMRNGQFDVFKFYIRLTDAWNSAQGLDISFYHGTTKVTGSVIVSNNSYGFDQTVTGAYQTIAIPMSNWVFSDSIFFSVVIKPLATPFSSQAFRLDWIQLQGGINQAIGGSSGLYIWNQYSLAQPANWWVAGNTRTEGSPTSPQRIGNTNTFYSGSEKWGQQAIANGIEALAIGAYPRATANGAIMIGSQPQGSGIVLSQYGTSNSPTNINLGGLGVAGTGNSGTGINIQITGNENVGNGETVIINGSRDVVLGYNGSSSHSNSAGIGYNVATTRNNEFILSSNMTSIEARGITRNVAGYVLTDSLGNGQYWVARPAASGGFTSADDGLTNNTSTNVRLFGTVGTPATLLDNRYLDQSTFELNQTGTTSGFLVNYTNASGNGLQINIDGLGVQSISNSSVGLYGQSLAFDYGVEGKGAVGGVFAITSSNSGVGLQATNSDGVGAGSGAKAILAKLYSTNNSVGTIIEINRRSDVNFGGVPAAGMGSSIDFTIATTTTAAGQLSNQIISKWTDATNATRTSQLDITGVYNASPNTVFTAKGNGDVVIGDIGAVHQSIKVTIDNAGKQIILDSRGGDTYIGDVFGSGSATYLGISDASKVIQSNGNGFLIKQITVTQAAALSVSNGMIVYVTNTDATFTSVGFWVYEAGAWRKM